MQIDFLFYFSEFIFGQGCASEYGEYSELASNTWITEGLPSVTRRTLPNVPLKFGIFKLGLQLDGTIEPETFQKLTVNRNQEFQQQTVGWDKTWWVGQWPFNQL